MVRNILTAAFMVAAMGTAAAQDALYFTQHTPSRAFQDTSAKINTYEFQAGQGTSKRTGKAIIDLTVGVVCETIPAAKGQSALTFRCAALNARPEAWSKIKLQEQDNVLQVGKIRHIVKNHMIAEAYVLEHQKSRHLKFYAREWDIEKGQVCLFGSEENKADALKNNVRRIEPFECIKIHPANSYYKSLLGLYMKEI